MAEAGANGALALGGWAEARGGVTRVGLASGPGYVTRPCSKAAFPAFSVRSGEAIMHATNSTLRKWVQRYTVIGTCNNAIHA